MIDLYGLKPEDFELLCYNYICNLYGKNKNYNVTHTRYVHDGGRDIEVTFYDQLTYFKIWAECKQHKRNIGLDEIGKNVVLVISKHVHSVIFFSVSEITENAKIEIASIGEKLNFTVSFLCGDRLIAALKTQPKLLKTYFGNYGLSNKETDIFPHEKNEITVKCSISEFEDDLLSPANNERPIYLRTGEMINIYVHLSNQTSHSFQDICVELCSIPTILKVSKSCWKYECLQSQDDIVAHFKGEIISKGKSRIKLPIIALSYGCNGIKQNEILSLPDIDISKCKQYPFIGKDVTEFLSHKISQSLEWCARGHAQIIDLRGISGSGKSRLASEIQKRASAQGLHSIYLNSTDYIEYDMVRKLLCELMHLPFYKGKINFSSEDVKELIRLQGGSNSFSDIVAKFMCQGTWEKTSSHYMVEAIAYYLKNSYPDRGFCLSIDNTQSLPPEILKMLMRLSEALLQNHSNTILILISNTERIAVSGKAFQSLLTYLDEKNFSGNPSFISYTCSAFREEDATLFLMQMFNFKNQHDPLLKKLLERTGRLPFELTMALEYFSDMGVIEWHNAKEWIIQDLEKLENFLSNSFLESNSILPRRVSAWKQKNSETQVKIFTDILSTITAFDGVLPYAYISDEQINQDILDRMVYMLWLKPSPSGRGITFFHDNIGDFCHATPQYEKNAKVLRKVLGWIDENPDIDIPHREKIKFFCYYNLNRFADAFAYGQEVLYNVMGLAHEDVVEISRILYNDERTRRVPKAFIRLAGIYADAVFSMDNKELGSSIFQNLVPYIKRYCSTVDLDISCKILHNAINSQLQSARYDTAIEWINMLAQMPNLPIDYKFIAENRYGVTYIALGQFEKAKEKLFSALSIASNIMENLYWVSTAHSDIALYYFYHWKAYGRECATLRIIEEFETAIKDYTTCAIHDVSRDIEMAWHKSFVAILKGQWDLAAENAIECIQLSEKYSQAYGLTRGYNLLALVQIFNGSPHDALSSLEEGLHACMLYSFPSGLFRMYNNLGVLYYRNGNYTKAEQNFKFALNTLSQQIEYKQYPVLANLTAVAIKLEDTNLARSIESRCKRIASDELFNYRKDLYSKITGGLNNDSFSFWGFGEISYIF